MNTGLFKQTATWMEEQMAGLSNPCVACSFGKDSMAMLHIARQINLDVPVVYVEQFPHSIKHQFAHRVASEWNLNMQPALPVAWRTYYGKPGHVEIVTGYHIGRNAIMAIPSEPMAALDEESCVCGLDILNQDIPAATAPTFDGAFIGQRNDDTDIVMGSLAITGNRNVIDSHGFLYLYPLRDWTSQDVWDYHELHGIPVNTQRYKQLDSEHNNDVWNLCTRCLTGQGEVFCPQEREMIPAFGDVLDLEALTGDMRGAVLNWENIES